VPLQRFCDSITSIFACVIIIIIRLFSLFGRGILALTPTYC
jgi:hypothetical protein